MCKLLSLNFVGINYKAFKEDNKKDVQWVDHDIQVVGPLVGHASDGDCQHKLLVLSNYKLTTSARLNVNGEVVLYLML